MSPLRPFQTSNLPLLGSNLPLPALSVFPGLISVDSGCPLSPFGLQIGPLQPQTGPLMSIHPHPSIHPHSPQKPQNFYIIHAVVFSSFLDSSPKGPISCTTQGGISRCLSSIHISIHLSVCLSICQSIRPSIHPSICLSIYPPPRVDNQGRKLALPGLNVALQASSEPSKL